MKVLPNRFDRLWEECGADVTAAIQRVGKSGWYVLGGEVGSFERALADWCGVPKVVGVANGLDAIEIALRLNGIAAGDKVLTTPLSAFATGLAILRAGATPVFCDTDDHGLLDPTEVERALSDHPDIRAIVPVHLYGHLADMRALQDIAYKHDILIIEDAAQAIGAMRGGIGVADNGRIAATSFYPTKNLGVIGDGGALLLHDEAQAQAAASLRNYGQTEKYVHDTIGLNSRLDELHAATLNDAFLPRLTGWLDRRRAIAAEYLDRIENPHVTLMPGPDTAGSGWHLFPVLVAPERRDDFCAHLADAGVVIGFHYPLLIPDQRAITDHGHPLVVGDLQRARYIASAEVSLPIHPYLTPDELTQVIDAVNAWGG